MDASVIRRPPRLRAGLHADVHRGLAAAPKRLPSKYFYDAQGSALFEAICAQPEYYLTRAEFEILRQHGDAIAAAIGPRAALIEFGSGAADKTRLLLHRMREPAAYLPVEISPTALQHSVAAFADEFPRLHVDPVCADFTGPLQLPALRGARRRVLFFPGSTLGNFDRGAAHVLLQRIARLIGRGGCALVGIDLQKDVATLEAAYNDAAGVTARFTLNLLVRINRELGADFDVAQYAHRARWNPRLERIDTHIVSLAEQSVRIDDRRYRFGAGEAMLVEYSCKYTLPGFARSAERAGMLLRTAWTDPQRRFAVVLLERATVQADTPRRHAARAVAATAAPASGPDR